MALLKCESGSVFLSGMRVVLFFLSGLNVALFFSPERKSWPIAILGLTYHRPYVRMEVRFFIIWIRKPRPLAQYGSGSAFSGAGAQAAGPGFPMGGAVVVPGKCAYFGATVPNLPVLPVFT